MKFKFGDPKTVKPIKAEPILDLKHVGLAHRKIYTYLLVEDRMNKLSRCLKIYFHSKYFLVIREVHLCKIQIQYKRCLDQTDL